MNFLNVQAILLTINAGHGRAHDENRLSSVRYASENRKIPLTNFLRDSKLL